MAPASEAAGVNGLAHLLATDRSHLALGFVEACAVRVRRQVEMDQHARQRAVEIAHPVVQLCDSGLLLRDPKQLRDATLGVAGQSERVRNRIYRCY
jgi:hypothetical protein